MDKKIGLLNVFISIVFKLVILVTSILVKRFVIRYLGDQINGLNSLYVSILDFLSVTELGVGTAITFCMFKPIVDRDTNKVSALYHLFTKLYFIIGFVILMGGVIIMPLLRYIAKDYQESSINLRLTFGLMLISVVLTYAFSSKMSLINAYKNNFISITITSVANIVRDGLQIIALLVTRSFIWFLICKIVVNIAQWIVTEIVVRIKYHSIISNKQKIDSELKKELIKNIKALFMHKIGAVLVNTTDSLVISAFIGITMLGKYSNYITIMVAMMSVIVLFFNPLTSVIGHMYVGESKEQVLKYFNFFHVLNFVLGIIFFGGYYAIIDDIITILFKDGLLFSRDITFVITLNYFVQFMEQAVRLFKDATGMFYYDRWKCVYEGILNIVLSILFVLIFPQDYAVLGVIVATIITNLLICHLVEPHVLYKYAFGTRTYMYYMRNYIYMLIFVVYLIIVEYVMVHCNNLWLDLILNGCIAVALAIVAVLLVIFSSRDFKKSVKDFLSKHLRKF